MGFGNMTFGGTLTPIAGDGLVAPAVAEAQPPRAPGQAGKCAEPAAAPRPGQGSPGDAQRGPRVPWPAAGNIPELGEGAASFQEHQALCLTERQLRGWGLPAGTVAQAILRPKPGWGVRTLGNSSPLSPQPQPSLQPRAPFPASLTASHSELTSLGPVPAGETKL